MPEVAAYSDRAVVVEEASYAAAGNAVSLYAVSLYAVSLYAVSLYAVTGLDRASDMTCPTPGAVAKEAQTNSRLDNFEGMRSPLPRDTTSAGSA